MIPYTILRENVLPVVNEDLLTIIGAEDRSWGIVEIDISGAGSSSNYVSLGLYTVGTAGVTGGGAITPAPANNTAMTAAAMVVYTTWGTQPVVGTLLHPIPLNENAARYYWKANHWSEVLWCKGGADNTSSRSLRALDVSGNVTARIRVIEI